MNRGLVTDIISPECRQSPNFDNTISARFHYIRWYRVLFINWQGMSDSGGRRITCANIALKLDYIKLPVRRNSARR
ncbi:MAG: hypothetical protein ACLR8Y_07960 [Alistipes indistinctus]